MIICLCGSLKFEEVIQREIHRLTLEGAVVLSPVFGMRNLTKKQLGLVCEAHKQKIKLADEVRIINVGGYIGEYTRDELQYAQSLNKRISYFDEDDVAVE